MITPERRAEGRLHFSSESRSLRSAAEKTWIGQRLSRRFVAGTTIEDALAATQAMNRLGLSVSVDNLAENVTNADEARHSAQLYHQMLDQMNARDERQRKPKAHAHGAGRG